VYEDQALAMYRNNFATGLLVLHCAFWLMCKYFIIQY